MSVTSESKETVRKIEDIIDIQKANGNFNTRQVAFNLPSETESTISANLVKSLESGLAMYDGINRGKKKCKKFRSKRQKSPMLDVASWPSDSDITVLRMKLSIANSELKGKIGLIPGDGLHHHDSSSMVNLATLILQSQPPSKQNLDDEFLLPLSSWEQEESKKKDATIEEPVKPPLLSECQLFTTMCSHSKVIKDSLGSKDSCEFSYTKKSKFARFLRLYFCPCCTCLYELEKMKKT